MNVLGIDIGGTTTKLGIISRDGQVLAHHHLPTTQYAQPQDLVQACLHWSSTQQPSIAAIGIGAPNGNFYKGTIEFAPNLLWKGIVPLAQLFSNAFGIPAWLTNDANAAAISEGLYGAARNLKDYLVVTLGTGVGSGFVANGQLIYGHDGFAGELGHTITQRSNGRACGCGRKGCLETYASVTGLVRTAREYLQNTDQHSLLRQYPTSELTGQLISLAAQQGDTLALQIFDDTAAELGFALAQAVAITSPQAIVFFGGLAQSGDLLLIPTRRYMEQQLLPIFQNKVQFLLSAVPSQYAAILGAAALAFQQVS